MSKPDADADPVDVLHEHRIGRLEISDDKQWAKISDHHDQFKELHVTMRLVKMGVTILGFVAFAAALWLRGGWEAVADYIFGR
jgi:hypothetical protein